MIVYKVMLTKIESSHSNLRTNSVEGITNELPTVGSGFILIGKSLSEEMDGRLVKTSEVVSVDKNENTYMFKTLNSTYNVEILESEVME